MNKFSYSSKMKLTKAHPKLKLIAEHVLKLHDCTVVHTYRDKETQDTLYATGFSKLQYPDSKHNKSPSLAIDLIPYPVDWHDTKRFYYFAGLVMATAKNLQIDIRWGGDWDRDNDLNDQSFMDLAHFELVEDEL